MTRGDRWSIHANLYSSRNNTLACGVSIYMERIQRGGFGLLILLAPSVGPAQTKRETPILSICDIRSQPKKYLGRMVTVTGEVQRTFHGISMSSSKCPNVGAALAESNQMRRSSALSSELFRQGTWKTLSCEDDGVFVVTVRGRFGTALTRNLRTYRIVIDDVLQAHFTQQTSPHCINEDIPPPDIKIEPEKVPDFSNWRSLTKNRVNAQNP